MKSLSVIVISIMMMLIGTTGTVSLGSEKQSTTVSGSPAPLIIRVNVTQTQDLCAVSRCSCEIQIYDQSSGTLLGSTPYTGQGSYYVSIPGNTTGTICVRVVTLPPCNCCLDFTPNPCCQNGPPPYSDFNISVISC